MSSRDITIGSGAEPGTVVYEVMHFKIGNAEPGDPESQTLGRNTYRSQKAALEAIERLRPLSGFRK